MINFLKYRNVCLAFSLLMLVAGGIAYVMHGGFAFHIDFVGGTEINVSLAKPIKMGQMRDALGQKGWKDLTIQSVGSPLKDEYKEFIVRVGDAGDELDKRMQQDLTEELAGNEVEIKGIARVSGEVGKDIQWNAFVSVLLCLIMILLYIAIRSKYAFAVGAVVALIHDLLAVLVVFLIFDQQISVPVLAAILAVLGYSINDTIVIYSKIRENFSKSKGESKMHLVNLSINQTLRRTLLTSFTTLLAVLAILFLGGEALRGFSLTMLVGIIAGTYSSIYIASPIMLALSPSE
jgi:preprotein translocase subunit SecF